MIPPENKLVKECAGMMISTRGRYALRVLIDLAQHAGEGRVSLKAIAERQEISLKYLESIVALLTKGSLLVSTRGKEGGYRLARPASEIFVGEVIRLTEGSLAPVACLCEDGAPCQRAAACLTLPMWRKLDQLIDDYLSSVSIEMLLNGEVEPSPSGADENTPARG